MSTLIAIGYPDEPTADEAAAEARRLAADLVIQPDAIAVIRRDREGEIHVATNHHPAAGNVSWGMFWGFLFGLLFFIPLFGMVFGAGFGALMGLMTKMDIDKAFQERVRDMLQPGTFALFLIVEEFTFDKTGARQYQTWLADVIERLLPNAPVDRERNEHRPDRAAAAQGKGRRHLG